MKFIYTVNIMSVDISICRIWIFLCQLTCKSPDIIASLCDVGVHVRVCVNNFSSKSTRPRDMLFLLKDTYLSQMKTCSRHVNLFVRLFPRAITFISEVPPSKVKISTVYHNFLMDYCRDFSLILHIYTGSQVCSHV